MENHKEITKTHSFSWLCKFGVKPCTCKAGLFKMIDNVFCVWVEILKN